MTNLSDRRGFLRGLVSLPLIGGGVTLIGRPSVALPITEALAEPKLISPKARARYAWTAFSKAMDEIKPMRTAGSSITPGTDERFGVSMAAHSWALAVSTTRSAPTHAALA